MGDGHGLKIKPVIMIFTCYKDSNGISLQYLDQKCQFSRQGIKEFTHKATEPRDCGTFFSILDLHKSLFLNLESANPQGEAVDSQGTRSRTSWGTDLTQGFSGQSHFYIRGNT